MGELEDFPIIGVGVSAGGLEAFIQLVKDIPKNSPLCFIYVQHLDPDRSSLASQIISKSSALKTVEITDHQVLKAGHIYVIPPNYNLEMNGRELNLSLREHQQRPHIIDQFFESLARARGDKAIGIVLSGTGTDGTNGLAFIQAEGGLTIVQDPQTAKFSGMPESAINSGAADYILPPEEMVDQIQSAGSTIEDTQGLGLKKIFQYLMKFSHIDFSQYKFPTIHRRIERRLSETKSKDYQAYAEFLKENPDEVSALYNDLLINVTEFFRNPESFEKLTQTIFPTFFTNNPDNSIRIWVAGCSTGEEVYSLAIALLEYQESIRQDAKIQFFATDISEKVISIARKGIYPDYISEHVSEARLNKYFERVSEGYRIRKEVRDLCLFSNHDMTNEPPFAKLDLISCRNVLIYFSPALQMKLVPIFHFALKEKGILWLGKSESPAGFSSHFNSLDKDQKFFVKKKVPRNFNFHFSSHFQHSNLAYHLKDISVSTKSNNDYQKEADKILLDMFAPPTVITNSDLEILQYRGRTSPYLEPPQGQPTNNLLKIARVEIQASLRLLMNEVKEKNKPVRRENLRFSDHEHISLVTIEVLPINPKAVERDRLYLTIFKNSDGATPQVVRENHLINIDQNELSLELKELKESQRLLMVEHETTLEELTSSNEELLSTNEELQSINEELETAKEELQATNEELITVNEELQVRNGDLTIIGNDLNNLLASTELPIIIVSEELLIRRCTPKAMEFFSITPQDIGRSIVNLNFDLEVNLSSVIKEVSRNLVLKEIEFKDANNNWKQFQIRPYRTHDNKIDGAIISVVDIDKVKKKENSINSSFEYITSIVNSLSLPFAVLDSNLQIKSANTAFYKNFKLDKNLDGKTLTSILNVSEDKMDTVKEILSRPDTYPTVHNDLELYCILPLVGARTLNLSFAKIDWIGHETESLLVSFVDVTERRQLEKDSLYYLTKEKEARAEAESANLAKDIFLATLSHELRTPLSAILTWSQLITSDKIDAETIRGGAKKIEHNAKIQSQLINDLLDISRIITGKMSLDVEVVDPLLAVQNAIENVQSLAAKKNIQLTLKCNSEDDRRILADPTRVLQIFWNLLSNAIKFSADNSEVTIEVSYIGKSTKGYVIVEIRDQGKGIPKEFLPHIFDRFSQADNASTRVHGGLGLGLSIVKHLVELQKGIVWAESDQKRKGSSFKVQFPLINDLPILINKTQEKEELINSGNPEALSLNGIRILYVEDDENTREALNIYLTSFGGLVYPAESAAMALKLFENHRPDIIISDIAMPDEDGHQFLTQIRKLPKAQGGDIPAIALTAFASAEDSLKSEKAGFQAHLVKPIEANKLIKMIKALLGK